MLRPESLPTTVSMNISPSPSHATLPSCLCHTFMNLQSFISMSSAQAQADWKSLSYLDYLDSSDAITLVALHNLDKDFRVASDWLILEDQIGY